MRTLRAATASRTTKRAAPTRKPPVLKVLPVLPQTVTEMINSWAPTTDKVAASVWPQIAPIVRGHLLAQNIGGPDLARKYIRALARHAAARHIAGHRIEKAEDLFSDEALTTTFSIHVPSTSADATRRQELIFIRRMRANLLPKLYGKSNELKIPRAPIATPYSQEELTALLAFARQRSSILCIKLHGALLLSLAAGLTEAELISARGSDLISTPWGLFIDTQGLHSGGNRGPRQVPILARYEDELSALAKQIGDDPFLGKPTQAGAREPGELQPRSPGVPHFKANRARSNWMLSLLEADAPFVALRQAGVAVGKDRHLNVLSASLTTPFPRYICLLRGSDLPFDQTKHAHLMHYAVGQ